MTHTITLAQSPALTSAAQSIETAEMPGGYGFFAWLIIGALAGWLASKFMGTDDEQGMIKNIVVGIVGAFIGGLILSVVADPDGLGLLGTFATAVAGACVLLFALRVMGKKK